MVCRGRWAMIGRLSGTYVRHGEKLRFLAVGGWNTVFSIGVLWLLDQAIPYDSTSVLQKEMVFAASWVIGVTQNFFTFKLLVFRTHGNWLREYLRMYVVYAVTFTVQSVLMLAISEVFGLSVFWANLPVILVITVMSYFGHKHYTFRQPERVFDESAEAATAE